MSRSHFLLIFYLFLSLGIVALDANSEDVVYDNSDTNYDATDASINPNYSDDPNGEIDSADDQNSNDSNDINYNPSEKLETDTDNTNPEESSDELNYSPIESIWSVIKKLDKWGDDEKNTYKFKDTKREEEKKKPRPKSRTERMLGVYYVPKENHMKVNLKIKKTNRTKKIELNKYLAKDLRNRFGIFDKYQKLRIIDAHNDIRREMTRFSDDAKWSSIAEYMALALARKISNEMGCRESDYKMPLKPVYSEYYSSNVFVSEKNFEAYRVSEFMFLDSWLEERVNFSSPAARAWCKSGTNCLHFTQMAWGKTESIGCAFDRCMESNGIVIACVYQPRGNVSTQRAFR